MAALAVTLTLSGSVRAATDRPSVIRIAFTTIGVGGRQFSANSTLAVAHVNGLMERALAPLGIKVEWQFFCGAGPAGVEAMAAHRLDFAMTGDLPSVIGRAAGLKTYLLLVGSNGNNAYVGVPANSSLKTLADLRGHTVADFKGTAQELAATRILATVGLTEGDLKLVNGAECAGAALAVPVIELITIAEH